MDKETYIKQSLEAIAKKNLTTPFTLAPGSTVTDLDLYLNSLVNSYMTSKDPRLVNLFQDKIEALKAL
ncbi:MULTISPECIES: hypothetical protein [Myroides]|uniref:Uncharacterized protein n=1 Tax=Myroides albus TaxID=2562892 RepID=A0A6I3LHJ6_9FLAO|nr:MULTISPECIES: hypothetical protein [Myroides]MTG97978.1 hypothetical protein [Myroides albus]MVX34984.1 hypothetical protein [Myroides sp. LoEW2-1]UVD80269.1 hypothetical protein NWE55_03000 [Myroides albus]